mmetsp:Transcript_17375/g.42820  ORF Transcript_17375/g.42820 Transcript_17375/m.42820 type:complete len:86 (-) Transcript_17375:225-482(-)
MQQLADTIAAIAEPGVTTIFIVFEDRGDCCWGTLNHFWCAAEAAGLQGHHTDVEDLLIWGQPRDGMSARRHNDSERLLLKLTKKP